MRKYELVPNKKQLKAIKKHWKTLQQMISDFNGNILILEGFMEQETGITGIEFFHSDDGYVGVGNAKRTMKLIQFK